MVYAAGIIAPPSPLLLVCRAFDLSFGSPVGLEITMIIISLTTAMSILSTISIVRITTTIQLPALA